MAKKRAFWEKVSEMMIGTNLGGESYTNYRIEKFKMNFFKEEENEAFRKHKLENQRRVKMGEPRKPFNFVLTDLQKDALDLITVMSVFKADEAPQHKVFAEEILEDVRKSPVEMQHEIVKKSKESDAYKNISEMADKFVNCDLMDLMKICNEATAIMEKENIKEKKRLEESYQEECGDFYRLHIQIASSYQWGEGWMGRESEKKAFEAEIEKILPYGKWKLEKGDNSGKSDCLVNGRSEVYLHPMCFTVFAKKKELETFAYHLQTISPNTFKVGKINLKEASIIKDMTHYEVLEHYKKLEKTIRRMLVENVKKYPHPYDLAEKVYNKIRINNTADDNYSVFHSNEIGWKYTDDLVKKLVKEKVLKENNKGYLSLNTKHIAIEESNEKIQKKR